MDGGTERGDTQSNEAMYNPRLYTTSQLKKKKIKKALKVKKQH